MIQKPYISKIILYIICQCTVFLIVNSFEYNLKGKHGEGYLIDISIGEPKQNFQVIVDTGSSNFAIAATKNIYTTVYFNPKISQTFKMLNKNVSSKYTQGKWNGVLGTDLISVPSISYNQSVQTDISLIHDTELFFKNNSEWQGLLGLAYSGISRPDKSVLSWIDAVVKANNQTAVAFSLELCGMISKDNSNHVGNFDIIYNLDKQSKYSANILRECFYEIAIIDIAVDNASLPSISCRDINNDKSIVDSGSTNLILPEKVYNSLRDSLWKYIVKNNISLTRNFWNTKDTSCFDLEQNWNMLPNISISIAHDDSSYFILDLPGPSYVKQVFSNENSSLNPYCYKVAIEKSTGNSGSILGAITMEGFKIIFNRTSKTIQYQKGHCGPNVGLRGLFYENCDIIKKCSLRNISLEGNFFDRNILPIFFISVIIMAAALVLVLILKKGKENSWTSHVFISMNRTPQLITED